MHDYWDGGWHMIWMGVWWLLGIALLIGLVWFIARAAIRNGGRPRDGSRGESAEEILRRRFARGEIDREEYQQTLTELRH